MDFKERLQETKDQDAEARRAARAAARHTSAEAAKISRSYNDIRNETIALVPLIQAKLAAKGVPPDTRVMKEAVMARHHHERTKLHPESAFPQSNPSMFHTLTLGLVAARRKAGRDNFVNDNAVNAWKMTDDMYLGEDGLIYGIAGMTAEERARGVLIPKHVTHVDHAANPNPTEKDVQGFERIQQGLANVVVNHSLTLP